MLSYSRLPAQKRNPRTTKRRMTKNENTQSAGTTPGPNATKPQTIANNMHERKNEAIETTRTRRTKRKRPIPKNPNKKMITRGGGEHTTRRTKRFLKITIRYLFGRAVYNRRSTLSSRHAGNHETRRSIQVLWAAVPCDLVDPPSATSVLTDGMSAGTDTEDGSDAGVGF